MDAAVTSSPSASNGSYQFFPRSLVRPIQTSAPPPSTPFKSRFLPKHQKSDPGDRSSASPDRSISSARPGNPYNLANFQPRSSLARLPEEGVLTTTTTTGNGTERNGNDRLSRDIKSFLGRTENIQDSWRRTGGQPQPQIRSASVARDDFDSSLRSSSMAPPSRNSLHFRASSVAPAAPSLYSSGLGGRDPINYSTSRYSNGNGNGHGRELSPLNSIYGRKNSGGPDFDFSYRDVVSVTRSVTGRAADLPLLSAGFSSKAGQRSKFMTLEEECNWILSGREPLPADLAEENGLDSDGEDDTLDDISGDEFEDLPLDNNSKPFTPSKPKPRLSEMTADLAEEHSTATLATERLEAEQSERMRLEKEKGELEQRNKQLHSTAERMEMELLYSRALDMNGGVDYSDEDGENSIYKQKYERAMKELEFTKRRLQQQHEDDMEQLVGLKKQLEKKLNDAYEEVDEQRQVVAQWKRKTQKLQGEMHDQKLLLEEQTSRNVLLEKRQRKFDAELGLLQEDRKAEAAAREKLQKEIDALKSTKYQLEEQITSLKLDLDFKDEKISTLNKELEDLHTGGASEEEVATLKRQKHELEMRLKEEEEEIDDLAGQVQLLEQSKIKLEMSMAAMKKEHRREISLKEEELEDARAATQKKVKALEQQLENEHEERINFVREKHELETKIINLQEMASRSADEEQVSKLKKDLKRTKALLKDAQLMIERSKSDSSNKVVMRQLKNQLEDSEFAKTAAIKAKQNIELELSDVQQQLDDVLRSKSDLEDKVLRLSREKADLSSQLDDSEEELQEVMKKYKASVSQLSVDQITIHEQANRIADIEEERNKLKEQIAELSSRIESLEGETIVNAHQNRLELKIKELESKLELEQTTRSRMETQINRLKEGIEKINSECDLLRNKELASQDMARKLQRQLRDLREDYATAQQKETEVNAKKNELEKQLELAEAETVLAKNDLKLAMKRIEDLQTAINVELDSESDSLNSDADSDSSEEGMEDFLEHHRRAVSVQRERESVAREAEARASIQREVRASIARESVVRTLETMSEEPEFKL